MKHNNIIGKLYQNTMTGNLYRCVAYDGRDLTLTGVGKVVVTFRIPLRLAVLKYREVR